MFNLNELLRDNSLKQEAVRAAEEINACLDKSWDRQTSVAIAAYLLSKLSALNNPFDCTLEELLNEVLGINPDVAYAAREAFTDESWKKLLSLVGRYSEEALAAAVFLSAADAPFSSSTSTPESLISLAKHILRCQAGDYVADVGCGMGSFLVSAVLDVPDAHYIGYEINAPRRVVSSIRAELLDCDMDIRLQDAFDAVMEECQNPVKYDKVFSNYPFGLQLRNLGAGGEYMKKISDALPRLSKATSSDWIFNSLLCDMLAPGGKAVGIMTNGSTWNSIDTPMRKYFLERGMVEAVVSLPSRLFSSTNIATSLIVLSHGNTSVRLVDATNLCQQGRRINEFSDSDIEMIVAALSEDGDYSKLITIEELRNNEYTLNFGRYLGENITFDNGVPFETVIKSITRGAQCKASELDAMASDSVTNMQYLMLANIKDGVIDESLPYLSAIEPQYDRYCLKDNDLILSKNGYPYKVAVASVKEGQRILASGNLYIIELDKERVDPYFLKAFFESEQGIAVLKSITVGATIPNIGVDKLKKITIPLPAMEDQERIAQKYRSALDEIGVLKLRLDKAVSRLHHIFDEEGND